VLALPVQGWQDDINLIFPFIYKPDTNLTFLPHAQGQLRLGRYLFGDKNHGWRGGAEGDVVLLSFNKNLLWHWALNMETLADDANDIFFRLVQVYYQSKTGLSWHINNNNILNFSWQHRCSHGADNSVASRILIRSGLDTTYDLFYKLKNIDFNLRSQANIYIIGQNRDLKNQAHASLFVSSEIRLKLKKSFAVLFGAGVGAELFAESASDLYFLATPAKNWYLDPLMSFRMGLHAEPSQVQSDYVLQLSQISDTGLNTAKTKHYGLSFDINFYW
jgi:hypothetical protein